MPDKLLTVRAVAEQTGLSVNYFYDLIQAKKLDHYKLGRTVRISATALEAWLKERERIAVSLPGKRGRPRMMK